MHFCFLIWAKNYAKKRKKKNVGFVFVKFGFLSDRKKLTTYELNLPFFLKRWQGHMEIPPFLFRNNKYNYSQLMSPESRIYRAKGLVTIMKGQKYKIRAKTLESIKFGAVCGSWCAVCGLVCGVW